MKKVLVTLSLVIVLGLGVNAQSDSFFSYNDVNDQNRQSYSLGDMPTLPMRGHDEDQSAPVGSGLLILAGLGAAYALKRKNN